MIRSILSWPVALCAIAFAAAPAAQAQRLDVYNRLRAEITAQVYSDMDGGYGYDQDPYSGGYSPLSGYAAYYESQLEQMLEQKLAGMSHAELLAFRAAADRAHFSGLATTSNPGYYRAKAMQKRALDAVLDRLIERAAGQQTGASAPNQQTGSSVPRQQTGSSVPRQQTGSSVPRQQTGSSVPRQQTGSSAPNTAVPGAAAPAPVWQRYPDGYMRTFYNGQWWIYDNGVVRADR